MGCTPSSTVRVYTAIPATRAGFEDLGFHRVLRCLQWLAKALGKKGSRVHVRGLPRGDSAGAVPPKERIQAIINDLKGLVRGYQGGALACRQRGALAGWRRRRRSGAPALPANPAQRELRDSRSLPSTRTTCSCPTRRTLRCARL